MQYGMPAREGETVNYDWNNGITENSQMHRVDLGLCYFLLSFSEFSGDLENTDGANTSAGLYFFVYINLCDCYSALSGAL